MILCSVLSLLQKFGFFGWCWEGGSWFLQSVLLLCQEALLLGKGYLIISCLKVKCIL